MADNFNILLGSKLDTSQQTITQLNSQINTLSSQLTKLNLKINIDSSLFTSLTQEFKNLSSKLDLNVSTGKLSSELDKLTHGYKYLQDGSQQLNKITTETTNQYGQQVKLVEKLNQKTGQLQNSELTITNNAKQRRKEEEGLLRDWLKAKDARANALQAEALAQNKLYDAKKQETSDMARKLIADEQKQRESIVTATQRRIEREILNSNETIADQQNRINKRTANDYEQMWIRLLREQESRVAKMGDVKGTGVNKNSFGDMQYIQSYIKDLYGLETQISKLQPVYENGRIAQWKFTAEQQNGRNIIERYSGVVDKNTESLYQNSMQTRENTNRQLGWAESMKTAMVKSVQWSISMGLLYGNLRKIREGVTFIKEMDDSLTQISMVTGKTTTETRKLADEYRNLGVELKTSISGLTTSAVSLFRQGLNETDVEERLVVIAKTARATAVDINQVTDFITAGVNSSKMVAEDYSDTLIKAASIAGTSFEELGEGMSKVVSAASVSGIGVSKLTSYLSTLSEVTRESSSSLGNSMKTIIARFNSVNEETGELNEDFNKVHTAIESVGISFLGLDGQIRPVSDILDDLSKIWNDLDKNTQQYISTQVAGVRQISRFQALMENYNRSLEINNELMDASGTLSSQYSTYLNSAEAAAQGAKVAFESMWMNALNSDAIKTFYNISASITNTVDKIGLLKTAVFGLSAVLLAGSKSFQSWSASMNVAKIQQYITNIKTLPVAYSLARTEMGVFQSGLFALGVSFDLAKVKAIALQSVMTLGLSVAISLVVSGLTKLIASTYEAKKAQEELIQSTVNNVQNTEKEIKQLENLRHKYEQLTQQKKQGKDVDEELLEVQRQLARFSDSLVTGVDNEGNAISENIALTEKLIQSKKDLLKQEMEVLQFQAKNKLPEIRKQAEEAKKELDEIQNQLNSGDTRVIVRNKGLEEEKDISEELNNKKLKLIQTQKELVDEQNKWLNIVNKVIDRGQIEIIATSDSQEAKDKARKTLIDYGLSQENVNDLVDDYIKKQKEANDTQNGSPNISKQMYQVATSFEDATDRIADFNKYIKEYNKLGKFSGEIQQEIIDKYPQFIGLLNDEGKLRETLSSALNDEKKAQSDLFYAKVQMSNDFINTRIKGEKTLREKLAEYYEVDLKNANNLAEAKTKVEQALIQSFAKMWGRYYDIQSDAITQDYTLLETLAQQHRGSDNPYAKQLQNIDDAVKQFKDKSGSFKSVAMELSGFSFDRINSGKDPKSSKTPLDKLFSAFPAYKEQITDLTNSFSTLAKEMSSLENEIKIAESLGDTERAIALQEQLIAKRAEERDLLHQTANALRGLQSQIKQDFKNKFNLDIANLTEVDIKKFNDTLDRQINDLQNKLAKATTDSAKNAIQKQIDALNQDKSMFGFLIDSFKTAGSEIEKLGSNWFSSFLGEQSDIKDNIGKKLAEIFKELDSTLNPLNSKLEDLNYEFKMLDSDNTSGKVNNIADKMKVLNEIISTTENELKRLNSTTPDNIKNTDEFKKKIEELEKSLRDGKIAIKEYADELKSINEKIADDAISAIKKSYEKQKEIVINSLKQQLKAEEDAHNKKIKNLDEQLSKYEEVINAQLKLIDNEQDEEQWNKELAKAQEEYAEIQRQINIHSLNNSLEGRYQVFELNKQLTDQELKIEEMKSKREVDLRKKNLNDQLNSFKKSVQSQKDAENVKFNAYKDNINKQIELEEWRFNQLLNREYYYADLRQKIIEGKQEETQKLMSEFLKFFGLENEKVVKKLGEDWNELIDLINKVKSAQSGLGNVTIPSTPSTPTGATGVNANKTMTELYNEGRIIMTSPTGYTTDVKVESVDAMKNLGWKIQTKHDGGIVGDGSRDLPGMVNKLFNVKPNEQIVKALAGELFIPQDNIAKNFIPNMRNLVSNIMPKSNNVSTGIQFGSLLTVNGNIDRSVMPDLEKLVKKAADRVFEIQTTKLKKLGV